MLAANCLTLGQKSGRPYIREQRCAAIQTTSSAHQCLTSVYKCIAMHKGFHTDPGSVPMHYVLEVQCGSMLCCRYSQAKHDAEAAVSLKPEWAKAHARLAAAFSGMGHLDKAVASYASCVRLAPDDKQYLTSLYEAKVCAYLCAQHWPMTLRLR